MMNGRNCQNNDFTFISTSGSSVIDYCVVPYEYISNIKDFSVQPISKLISGSNIHCTLDSPGTYLDHSLLVWTISVENRVMRNCSSTNQTTNFEVFDRNIPTDFLDSQSEVLNTYISQIEQDVSSQEELYNIYSHLMRSIKEEMVQSLSHRTVIVKSGSSNRKRKTKKPWWTTRLTELWNGQCDAEKSMLKSKSRTERKGLRKRFIEKRKLFNREVQRSKRAYTLQSHVEIEYLETTNPNLFWKEIGKIGIGQERRKFIPMEVTRDDGSISSDTGEVLNKWKNSFEALLNPVNGNVENIYENHPVNDSQADAPLCFTEPIHFSEVAQAIRRLKLNKSTGIDDIPAEVLKSSSLLHILCSLFNRCLVVKCRKSGIAEL